MDGTRPPILETSDTPISVGESPLVFQKRSESNWKDEIRRRWRWLAGGTLGIALLCGTAALMAGGPDQEIKGQSGTVTPNKHALLSLTEQDYGALSAQVQLQIDESYRRLIDLEAVRFLGEAERQITDLSADCYRQGIDCVLDQFEGDALAMYRQGAQTLDRGLQLEAILRLQIVQTSRSGLRVAQEPDNALTAAAIQRRLEARQLKQAASAESMAAELLED